MLLSLYGGEGAVAKAAARGGMWGAVLGLAHDSANDLARPRHQRALLACLPRCSIVGIDLPCQTWSRARRAPPGSSMPSALRGDDPTTIMGLPNLSAADLAKVAVGNRQWAFALQIIKHCLRLGIPGYAENPQTSRLWKLRSINKLGKLSNTQLVDFHMCQFGTQWKKPTRLLVWGPTDILNFLKVSANRFGVQQNTQTAFGAFRNL